MWRVVGVAAEALGIARVLGAEQRNASAKSIKLETEYTCDRNYTSRGDQVQFEQVHVARKRHPRQTPAMCSNPWGG